MPAKIGQGASNMVGNLVTSTEKLNNETYDMNDEECTDNSAEVSESASKDDLLFPIRNQTRNLKSSLLRVTQAATSSQTQARGIISHLQAHVDESTGHQVSLDLDSVASKVSWSDSEGSTYESEHYQDQKVSLGSSNSMENLGTPIAHDEKSPSSKALNNPRMPETTKIIGNIAKSQKVQFEGPLRPTTKDGSPRLEHVDYYSYIDVATTNDGLSSIGFISKEDTRPIFCRRIVPLEIPVQRRPSHDDVSAFSSCDPPSVMPIGDSISVQAVHTRRATVQQPREATLSIQEKVLKHIDYLPNIDVSDHHDISTITCRISCQDAASALHNKRNEDRQLVPLTLGPLGGPLIYKHPAYHNRMDSISTLGSVSVTSVASEARLSSFDADDDTGSSTKSTPTKSVKPLCDTSSAKNDISPFSHTSMYSNANSCDHEYSLHTELPHQNQETTSQRIQNLKEKIKQMQVASTMENLPDTGKILPTLTESSERTTKSSKYTSRNVGTTMRNEHVRQAPKEEDARKSQKASRLNAVSREIDVQKRFQIHDKDRSLSVNKNILKSESSLSHEKPGEVPSVVTPLVHDGDDISTIHCDVACGGSKEFVDVELEGSPNEPKFSGQTLPRVVDRSFRALATTVNSLARNANTLLEHCMGYHHLKTLVTRIWIKYVQGRSRTEQAILGVILLSFSILFILVISLISG